MKKKAFTLIELLIVIAVVAILFIVVLSKVNFAADRAKDSGVLTDFRSYQIGIQQTIREENLDPLADEATFAGQLNRNLDKKMQFKVNGTEYQSVAYNSYGYHYVLEKDGTEIKVYSIKQQGGAEILTAGISEVYAANEYSVGKVMVIGADDISEKPDIVEFGNNSSVGAQTKAENNEEPAPTEHQKPVAFITMTPNTAITEATTITWEYGDSTCEDGANVVDAEWTGAQSTYTVGEHTVILKVKDSNGLWSDPTSVTFTVAAMNHAPTAVITMTPDTGININTTITWAYANSTDPDAGDSIVEVKWTNAYPKYETPGNYTVSLEVKDSHGAWSAPATVNITVRDTVTIETGKASELNYTLKGIAYGNGQYVAVGASGRLAVSTDGVTWVSNGSPLNSGTTNTITYGTADKFVLGGTSGRIAETTGSLGTMASSTPFSTNQVNDICYGSGKYVAVGDMGKLSYSTDRSYWYNVSSPVVNPQNGVCYGNGKFVTVGYDVVTSTNGVDWLKRTSPFTGYGADVVYGNSMFVAVSKKGEIATSPDGVTWTLRTSPFGVSAIYGIAYGNGAFVAVGDGCKVAVSKDGVNWELKNNGAFTVSLNSVTFGNNEFIAVGTNSYYAKIIVN